MNIKKFLIIGFISLVSVFAIYFFSSIFINKNSYSSNVNITTEETTYTGLKSNNKSLTDINKNSNISNKSSSITSNDKPNLNNEEKTYNELESKNKNLTDINNNSNISNKSSSITSNDKPNLNNEKIKSNDFWLHPSTEYPNIKNLKNLSILVDTKKQLVYIKSGNEILAKLIASTGIDYSPTPKGTFVIENERGKEFYSPRFKEGAYYWTSFKDHGLYLFHSVPFDKNKNIIKEEATKLGSPASHGCVRLSLPDAKWIFENIPTGTKVIIE